MRHHLSMDYRRWIVLVALLLNGCVFSPQIERLTVTAGPIATLPVQPSEQPTGAIPTILPTNMPTSAAEPSVVLPSLIPIVPTSAATATLPASTEVAELEQRMAEQINQLRQSQGLAAYTLVPVLSEVARAHSCDMATNQFIGHVSSDGRKLAERIPSNDPPWIWPSENVAAGFNDPAAVIALWMDEPPDGWHRKNLLSAEQTHIGVGYCYREDDPSGNRHYWTIDVTRQ